MVEEAVGRLIARDPRAAERWSALAGRRLGLRLEGLDVAVFVLVTPGGVALGPWMEEDVDAAVEGPPFTLLRMAAEKQPAAHLFGGRVRIHGDQALVQRLRGVFAGLDLEPEELAAGLLGDPLARLTGRALGAVSAWWRGAGETLAADGRELLEEELELCPTGSEVTAFRDEVETLRDDVERLAARIALLEKGSAGTGP